VDEGTDYPTLRVSRQGGKAGKQARDSMRFQGEAAKVPFTLHRHAITKQGVRPLVYSFTPIIPVDNLIPGNISAAVEYLYIQ
jgi:hypothetical protein